MPVFSTSCAIYELGERRLQAFAKLVAFAPLPRIASARVRRQA
jgi:hypothetical protein